MSGRASWGHHPTGHQPIAEINDRIGTRPMVTFLTLMEGRMLGKREDLGQRREAGRGSWRTVRKKTLASSVAMIGPVHLN